MITCWHWRVKGNREVPVLVDLYVPFLVLLLCFMCVVLRSSTRFLSDSFAAAPQKPLKSRPTPSSKPVEQEKPKEPEMSPLEQLERTMPPVRLPTFLCSLRSSFANTPISIRNYDEKPLRNAPNPQRLLRPLQLPKQRRRRRRRLSRSSKSCRQTRRKINSPTKTKRWRALHRRRNSNRRNRHSLSPRLQIRRLRKRNLRLHSASRSAPLR